MKSFLILVFSVAAMLVQAQTNTTGTNTATSTHTDSLYLAKLNSNGNLMIAGGVGLCAAGGFLVYQGVRVYNAGLTGKTPDEQTTEQQRNHKQGTAYLVGGGVALAGGIVLTAFGARNKLEFKKGKKRLELQGGILDNGHLGLALNF